MALTTTATVTSASPLKIATLSSPTHPMPARRLSSYTPVVGDLVRVEVYRSGLTPMVQAKIG